MNKKLASLLVIGFLSFIGSQTTMAQEEPVISTQNLTVEDALTIAFENNPSLKAASFEIEKQQNLKSSAIDFEKTSVSYTRGQINSDAVDYQWEISQDFKFPTVYGTQSKLQNDRIALSETSLILKKNNLERQVRAVYMQLQYAKSKLQLIEELENEFKNFAVIAEKRFETGETNLIEKMSAKGKREEIRLLKSESQLDVENLQRQLQLLLNVEEAVTISEAELTKSDFIKVDSVSNESPILMMQEKRVAISEREHKLEKAQFLPDISAGYFNQQIEGIKNFSGFQVGVKVPIFLWAQDGKAKAARVNSEIAQLNFEQTKLDMNSALKSNIQEFEKHQASLIYYESQGLQLSDKLFFSANKAYKEGEIGYVEYIATLEQAISIKNDYLDRLNLYNQTINEINYLTGKY